MDPSKKQARYQRIYSQIEALMPGSPDSAARMATIAAILHHKIDYFFWTGFYLLRNGKLTIQTYQGPLACMVLREHTGVCWAGIDQGKTIVVPDVRLFAGHIACDARSRSEIVVPIRKPSGEITGVLDVDSRVPDTFDETDALWLEKITSLIYSPLL